MYHLLTIYTHAIMKKIILLFLFIPFIGIAQTLFEFNTAGNLEGWDVCDSCSATYPNTTDNTGALTLKYTGKNGNLIKDDLAVNGSTYKVIAITLKNVAATGPDEIQVRFPKNDLTDAKETFTIPQSMTEFVTFEIDLSGNTSWGDDEGNALQDGLGTDDGLENYIKLVPRSGGGKYNGRNEEIIISKIEFLEELSPLPQKLDYTFDTLDDVEGWVGNGKLEEDISIVVDEGLKIKFYDVSLATDGKAAIDQPNYSVDPSAYQYLYVVYKNESSNDTFRFQYGTEDGNSSISRNTSAGENPLLINTTGAHVLKFDFTAVDNWKLKDYAFDFNIQIKNEGFEAAEAGFNEDVSTPGTFYIKRLLFSDQNYDESQMINNFTLDTKNTASKEANIVLSPNPVENTFTVHSDQRIAKIEVYNSLGQIVLTGNNNTANVNQLHNGIYTCKIYQADGSVTTKRFVKQ